MFYSSNERDAEVDAGHGVDIHQGPVEEVDADEALADDVDGVSEEGDLE